LLKQTQLFGVPFWELSPEVVEAACDFAVQLVRWPPQFRAVLMSMFMPGSAGVCKLSQPVRVC